MSRQMPPKAPVRMPAMPKHTPERVQSPIRKSHVPSSVSQMPAPKRHRSQ